MLLFMNLSFKLTLQFEKQADFISFNIQLNRAMAFFNYSMFRPHISTLYPWVENTVKFRY